MNAGTDDDRNIRRSPDPAVAYDLVADEYVRRICDELRHKPLDRQLLDRFAARIPPGGIVGDLGCGPGHVARYLKDRGVKVSGVDLSPEMVLHARHLNPDMEFVQGNMMSLDCTNGAWAGALAFYSIIHIPLHDLACAFREIWRVLQPGGVLLLAFHLGESVVHLEEWWGRKVSIDFFFFRSDEIAACLRSADFEVEEIVERDPYPDVEHPSRRAYVFALKPRDREGDDAGSPRNAPFASS
jgi:SAM-dependent methyltransferase